MGATTTAKTYFDQLTLLSTLGTRLLAMVAESEGGGVGSERQPSGNSVAPVMMIPGCCQLALPNTECAYTGSKDNYRCPAGYYRQWWYCTEGTRRRGCGECTTSNSNCWTGQFVCSIWWWA